MKIDIKSTGLDITPALSEYITEKISSLDHFISQKNRMSDEVRSHASVEAFVEISRTSKHHRHGEVFRAEVNLKAPGRLLRAEHEDSDIRTAIDAIKEELKNEIVKEKGIFQSKFKRGARLLKRMRSLSPLAWFRKEE